MPPRKRIVRKNPRRKQIIRKSPFRWLVTKTYAYEDEVYEHPMAYQTCISCYEHFQFDWNKKFDIRNRFCRLCREAMPFKKWLVLRKFNRTLEESLNRREPTNDITKGGVLQFVNGVYQSLRHNKSREYLLESISCTMDIGHLSDPIELSQLMEVYDAVTGAKKKSKTDKKKKRRQRRKKGV